MTTTSQKVSEFYNQYPYPLKKLVCEEPTKLDLINFWGGYEKGFSDDLRVLVAGCGTNEAVSTALSFPNADITAIDLSETSIEISKKIAAQFDLSNIQFLKADISEPLNFEPFDYISSFGVLHHLKDPSLGLKNLKQVLKPQGIMELMLYSETHRYFIGRIQRIVSLLAGDESGFENKFEIAKNFMASATPDSWPYGVYIERAGVRDLAERDPPSFADTYVHPQETTYDYPALISFLESAQLKLTNFSNPAQWDIAMGLYGNALLQESFQKMGRDARYELTDMLNGPLYIFYCRDQNDDESYNHRLEASDYILHAQPKLNKTIYHHLTPDFERSTTQELAVEFLPYAANENFVEVSYAGQTHVDNQLIQTLYSMVDGKISGNQMIDAIVNQYQVDRATIEPVCLHLLKKLYQLKTIVP